MYSTLKKACMAALTLAAMHGASAAVVTFANNPTGNSVDFASAVAGGGGTISTLTLDDQATGALNPAAYAGVTLTGVNFTTVANGSGPGQTGTAPTLSSGEGAHGTSNYLYNAQSNGSLTLTFDAPVFGAGLFTIDLFNPAGLCGPAACDDISLKAYTGANGTGTLLGTATGAALNFQANNLYFLGIYSSAGDIGSVVFRQNGSVSGDLIGLDDIQIATNNVPEPASMLLVGLSLAGLAVTRKRQSH